jgi:hypothetical protein
MSDLPSVVTPSEIAVEAPQKSPSSRSISVISTSSLARWRQSQGMSQTSVSTGPTPSSSTRERKEKEERRTRHIPPAAVITDATERETASVSYPSPHDDGAGANAATTTSPNHSRSIDERSYRAVVSDHIRRSPSDSQLDPIHESTAPSTTPLPQQSTRRGEVYPVAGDDPMHWSFEAASSSSASREPPQLSQQRGALKEGHETSGAGAESPTAIAAAVPGIAQARESAADAYADRWTDAVRRSTVPEEEFLCAFRQLETELREAEKRMTAAEARQQREVSALKAQLQIEKEARLKAERDREELLNQATISPVLSPRTTGAVGGCVLHVNVEGGNRSRSSANDAAAGASATSSNATGGNSTTATYISEAFYEKMKEREDRARARVRKEFVRQAQESIYAEQRKAAEAEKAAALASRRLQQVEEEVKKAQSALQDANAVMEAKDVQLHERAIHIQELETQLRLLQRQRESAAEAAVQNEQQSRRKLEEMQKLADLRQSELEAQRGFAQQLQEQLGLKTRDLFEKESSQQSVLQLILALQTRCKSLEADLESAVREATALLDQRRQHAEAEADVLRQRNEELKQRCAAADGEVASMKGQRECDAKEMALLRERYERDLSEQHVEVRSLQLQLERVLDAAKQRSAESLSATEIERQQQQTLLRKYAAEATAAREELDRTRAAAQRANEEHLRTTLELSQQLTALKQANTRLEHRVNILEHESADATRLLSRARDELTQLREERRRLSASLVEFREDSRMRSALESQDVLQRRVAELENVRHDLNKRLLYANQTIEDMQRRSQYMGELNSRCSQNESQRVPSVQGVLSSAATPRPKSPPAERESHIDAKEKNRPQQSSRQLVVSTAPSSGLPELLELMVELLEPIIHPFPQTSWREGEAPKSTAAAASASATSAARLGLQERRQQLSLSPEEREALDRVLTSCTAALRCNSKSLHIVDSPSKLGEQNEREEEHVKEKRRGVWKDSDNVAGSSFTPAPLLRDPAAQPLSTSVSRCDPSSPVDLPQQQQQQQQRNQQRTGVPKAELPSPQEPLTRPRRSSQPSLSSVATDDMVMRFSHTSETPATPLLHHRRPMSNENTDGLTARQQRRQNDDSRKPEHEKEEVVRMSTDTSLARNATVTQRDKPEDRDELESEPCWDSRVSEPASAPRRNESRASSSSSSLLSSQCSRKAEQQRLQGSDALLGTERKAYRASFAPPSRPQRSAASVTASLAVASASPSASVSVQNSAVEDPLVLKLSHKTPARGAAVESVTSEAEKTPDTEWDGILRYSRIPEEALSPLPKEVLRDAAAAAAAVQGDAGDATPSLFSNVQYVSAGSSVTRSAHGHPHRERELRSVSSSASQYDHYRQRAVVPDGALVLDVHQSTPPPPRGRTRVN